MLGITSVVAMKILFYKHSCVVVIISEYEHVCLIQ